jgi:hypothetical protein
MIPIPQTYLIWSDRCRVRHYRAFSAHSSSASVGGYDDGSENAAVAHYLGS